MNSQGWQLRLELGPKKTMNPNQNMRKFAFFAESD